MSPCPSIGDDEPSVCLYLIGPPFTLSTRLLGLPRSLRLAPLLSEWRVGILDQNLKILLEPCAGLRRRHDTGVRRAHLIVPHGVLVTSAVTLTARLHPHKGVEELGGGVRRGPDAEAGVLDVAPVAPLETAGGLGAGAAGVDDEVGGEGGVGEVRCEGGVELGFVPVGVSVGVVQGLARVVLPRVSFTVGSEE